MNTDDREWTAARDAAVWGEHGIASLAATHWLDDVDRAVDGAPGLWHAADGLAVGSGPGLPSPVELSPGRQIAVGTRALRAMSRDGSVALRVFDPDAAARRGISAIVRAPFDPDYVRPATFAPSPAALRTESVDGYRSTATYDGVVAFTLSGESLELTVETLDDGILFAAFSDGTSGAESYPFRFLRLAPPEPDRTLVVDLNRAYLPPCAFSDHYVCVMPPPGNRWSVPVRAGELRVH